MNNSSSLFDLYVALGALAELRCHTVYVNLIQPAAFNALYSAHDEPRTDDDETLRLNSHVKQPHPGKKCIYTK